MTFFTGKDARSEHLDGGIFMHWLSDTDAASL